MSEYVDDENLFFESKRYTNREGIGALFGATGDLLKIFQQQARQDLGSVGLAIKSLRENMVRFEHIINRYGIGDWSEKIDTVTGTLHAMPGVAHMDMMTLAGVIVFLYISGTVAQGNINITDNYQAYSDVALDIFDFYNVSTSGNHNKSFKIPHPQPPIGNVDDQIVLLRMKQTFVRYHHKLVLYAQALDRNLSELI